MSNVATPNQLSEWIDQIGVYNLSQEGDQDKVILDRRSQLDSDPSRRDILYGKHKDTKQSKDARVAFLEYLHKQINENNLPQGSKDKTISMEELLGKEGLKLYKKAIREENRS